MSTRHGAPSFVPRLIRRLSIPIAILLDRDFRELGRWGPRPAPLQAWVSANRKTIPKEGLIRGERRWYAMDKGETTFRELLELATQGTGNRKQGTEN